MINKSADDEEDEGMRRQCAREARQTGSRRVTADGENVLGKIYLPAASASASASALESISFLSRRLSCCVSARVFLMGEWRWMQMHPD